MSIELQNQMNVADFHVVCHHKYVCYYAMKLTRSQIRKHVQYGNLRNTHIASCRSLTMQTLQPESTSFRQSKKQFKRNLGYFFFWPSWT